MGGDFNCPLNPIVGNLMPRRSVINAIEHLQWELDLHDIWCIKNPTDRSFTWSQPEPLVLSRLDYWLISNSLSDNVCDVDIIASIKTDHSAIKIEFKDFGDGVKVPIMSKNTFRASNSTFHLMNFCEKKFRFGSNAIFLRIFKKLKILFSCGRPLPLITRVTCSKLPCD